MEAGDEKIDKISHTSVENCVKLWWVGERNSAEMSKTNDNIIHTTKESEENIQTESHADHCHL